MIMLCVSVLPCCGLATCTGCASRPMIAGNRQQTPVTLHKINVIDNGLRTPDYLNVINYFFFGVH